MLSQNQQLLCKDLQAPAPDGVVDDRLGVVGSANWDFRSLYSNYETLLTAYDRDFAATLKRMMNEDLNASREVAWPAFKNRPIRHRYLENACGLLAPLL